MSYNRRTIVFFLALTAVCWFYASNWGQGQNSPAENLKDGSPIKIPAENPSTSTDDSSKEDPSKEEDNTTFPLIVLGVGIATVLGLIIFGKVNAFIALITAAIVVSLLAPGAWAGKISRVATAFGSSVGGIGIVIAMAAVIGKCMLDSGAADRIVRAFLNVLGEKRSPIALMGSGFVLAVPVFFDTVFYLLVPLARSLYRTTNKNYLMYILAIAAGGAITHTLVPPTPGPLMMASNLGFDVGTMIMVGLIIALPAAIAGLIFAKVADHFMDVPMRQVGNEPDPEPLKDEELPSLFMSLLPVILPVLLISANTIMTTVADSEHKGLLTVEDVQDWDGFRAAITSDDSAVGNRIVAQIEGENAKAAEAKSRQALLGLLRQPTSLDDAQKKETVAGINAFILGDKQFHREDDFFGVRINATAKGLLSKDRVRMKKVDAERMNRALLESAFPALLAKHQWDSPIRQTANITAMFGNANLALLISTVIAMGLLFRQRGLSRIELAQVVETALMSGGVIILITAGGGAFGAMLKEAQVGEAIKSLFSIDDGGSAGSTFLILGFGIAMVLKVAQGSSTVAMITGSAMLAGIASPEILHFHPVYLATAIGAGSLVGSWMNDSGFWIFTKMGGLTEVESLKAWSLMLVVLGLVSFGMTYLLAIFLLPLT